MAILGADTIQPAPREGLDMHDIVTNVLSSIKQN